MQVEAATALAPVLARFAIVVDGPLEAEVVGRLAMGGDRTTLADLARPFPGRPDLSRAEAVGVARTVITRMLASGAVEPLAGGYRIADPSLASALRHVVESVAVARAPATTAPTATGVVVLPAPVAPEEASRLLQQALTARALPLPQAGTAIPSVATVRLPASQPTPGSPAAGSTTFLGTEDPAGAVIARLVVADPEAPVATVAPRLAALGPVSLSHLPAPAVRWGQLDPAMARASADGLAVALAQPSGAAPLVADRGTVPALALLARDPVLPPVLIVDLRSAPGPAAAPRVGAAPTPMPDAAAAAMAGAAAATAPPRRAARRVPALRDRRTLLEVLFGPHAAEALDDDEPDGDPGEDQTGHGAVGTSPVGPGRARPQRRGMVVTARTDDPQAEALAELLGVEVRVMRGEGDLGDEVLAWLEDDEGQVLLPPRT